MPVPSNRATKLVRIKDFVVFTVSTPVAADHPNCSVSLGDGEDPHKAIGGAGYSP
jgi:hypothetical protein